MDKVVKNKKMTSSRIHAPSPEDEIVISGISGKFPSAKNVSEFAEKLYNKVRNSNDPHRNLHLDLKKKTKTYNEHKV